MNEATCVANLKIAIERDLPGAVVFKHADIATAGIPDVSVTWRCVTVWLEVKYRGGRIETTGIQKATLQRLHQQSHGLAFYVIYDYRKDRTAIVQPAKWEAFLETGEAHTSSPKAGDHRFVTAFLKGFVPHVEA